MLDQTYLPSGIQNRKRRQGLDADTRIQGYCNQHYLGQGELYTRRYKHSFKDISDRQEGWVYSKKGR